MSRFVANLGYHLRHDFELDTRADTPEERVGDRRNWRYSRKLDIPATGRKRRASPVPLLHAAAPPMARFRDKIFRRHLQRSSKAKKNGRWRKSSTAEGPRAGCSAS